MLKIKAKSFYNYQEEFDYQKLKLLLVLIISVDNNWFRIHVHAFNTLVAAPIVFVHGLE